MFLECEETCRNSKERPHTLEPRATKPYYTIKTVHSPKVYVRTARMLYAKVGNFLTWSDFTSLSVKNWSFRFEITSFNYAMKANYQFARTNIIIFFNTPIYWCENIKIK